MPDRAALRAAAERLRGLHHGERPLVLPNAWDVASAEAVARAGAAAVATTSSGVAATLGFPDGEAISPGEMLAAVKRIAVAVELPVTADLEAGYGLDARTLVRLTLEAGAVGMNLEDTERRAPGPRLAAAEANAERLAAVRAAADGEGVPLVLNARVDVFLRGSGSAEERLEEAIRRAKLYVQAGADCVYPIGLGEAGAIRRVVAEVGAPVNILLRPGTPGIAALASLGVRRISVGGGLFLRVTEHVEQLARELVNGTDDVFLAGPTEL